jgi:hypothetical protein
VSMRAPLDDFLAARTRAQKGLEDLDQNAGQYVTFEPYRRKRDTDRASYIALHSAGVTRQR